MNFQEQLRYDKLQRLRERLHPKKVSGAGKTEENVQSAINATIEAKPEAKEKDPNIVELDSENYGAPPENSGIAAYKKGMKSPNASYTEPQAWEDEK